LYNIYKNISQVKELMLISLYVKNFALVEKITLDFYPGLNVLTGETGAGKSIIIDTVQLLTGGRAAVEYIRTGQEKALVQGVFDLARTPDVILFLKERGFEPEEDGILLMSREITQGGKNICRINQQITTLSAYREIGQALINLHGQQEQQTLLTLDRQRDLLDKYGGPELQEVLDQVKKSFYHWQAAKKTLDRLGEETDRRAKNIELLKHQLTEINAAALQKGEEETLLAEKNWLVNAAKIARLAGQGYGLLYEGGAEQPAALELLGETLKITRELAETTKEAVPLQQTLEDCSAQLKEVSTTLFHLYEKAEHNPPRLAALQERLETIRQLKRKYGPTIEDILARKKEIAAALEHLTKHQETFEALEKETAAHKNSWEKYSSLLSELRRKAALALEKMVASELGALEMKGVNFKISFSPLTGTEPSPWGKERVEFLIAPNPGEPLKSLAKIASGGELARIMLALKSILAAVDEVPTLIFDEVDTGIGGKALATVAEKLAYLGQHCQVICVTHAAQVAAYAKAHYAVFKEVSGGHTRIKIKLLDTPEKLLEITRMLGGTEKDNIVKEHARQLLEKGGV
jgi:DNA repair protein RecN (Recombination protein N)